MSIYSKSFAVTTLLLSTVPLIACHRDSADRPNVILLVVDTLRADHLSCYGYERKTSPVIDDFAEKNLKFDLAMAAAPWTAPSVASIFTGLYPTAHGVNAHTTPEEAGMRRARAAILDSDFETLAEALQRNGYNTAGVTGNAWVADYLGFAQGFDEFITLDYRTAVEINSHAFRLIEKLAENEQPFFLYVHYMDPHMPYAPPQDLPAEFRAPLRNTPHIQSQKNNIDLYDGEIRFVDSQIGKLFERLRSFGLFRDAVIVVVSDHGEQFLEHGDVGHDQNVFNYLIHVPLILKAPGARGRVKEAVGTLDIYPTIMELTQTRLSGDIQGLSLLRPARNDRPGVFSEFTNGRNHKALTRSDGKKLILAFDAEKIEIVDETQEREPVGLFDISADYYEKSSLHGEHELFNSMRSAFYAIYHDSLSRRRDFEPQEVDLEPETIRELKALGYLQ